jgi:DNA polymerase-1
MKRIVFDIETDGLLKTLTKVWIICAIDIDTLETRQWLPFQGEMGWIEVFNNAEVLIGHNVKGFDFSALEKVYGYIPPRSVNIHDTLIMSIVLNYLRFGMEGHSMARWGEYLGHAKVEHEDWSQYSEEMRIRCSEDVLINVQIYQKVIAEYRALFAKNPNIKPYMRAEHFVAEWCARAELHGWPFDVPAATELFAKMEIELAAARARIQPLLGFRTKPKDRKTAERDEDEDDEKAPQWSKTGQFLGEVETKFPKWTKQGAYAAHTANWFGVDPWTGHEDFERPIDGEYCRVEFVELDLDSVTDTKVFLFRNGWQPTEWNYKKKFDPETRRMTLRKTSPKITEDSLEVMQGNGKMYCDFLTTKSRHSILKTWLAEVDENGDLHGECFTIGTPSMRARHKIIVNVPSVDSAWGKEMRSLFIAKPGWKLIGCDSAGNQARGLAHYLKNDEFVDLLLNGDIHQYNANVATKVLLDDLKIEHTVPRSVAKRILYAFLFGASGGKLWSYIFGTQDKTKGKKFRDGFLKAVPGFEALIKKLEKIFNSSKAVGDGYIPSIAGNRVYVDSPHKLLVYLLQSCEKATCSAAAMLAMERLEAAGIPYIPCIFMHDEIDFQVPEEFAEQARDIGKTAFQDGPKLFNVQIMDGDGKIGNSWYDVH